MAPPVLGREQWGTESGRRLCVLALGLPLGEEWVLAFLVPGYPRSYGVWGDGVCTGNTWSSPAAEIWTQSFSRCAPLLVGVQNLSPLSRGCEM